MLFDGYIIFWDDQGTYSQLCKFCYGKIPKQELVGLDIYPSDHGEADSPQHCENCHRPLTYRLTDSGVEYVLARLGMALDWGIDFTRNPGFMEYYAGSPGYAVEHDWADDLSWYGLSDEQQDILDRYLDLVYETKKSLDYRVYWTMQGLLSKLEPASGLARKLARWLDSRYEETMVDIITWRYQ